MRKKNAWRHKEESSRGVPDIQLSTVCRKLKQVVTCPYGALDCNNVDFLR